MTDHLAVLEKMLEREIEGAQFMICPAESEPKQEALRAAIALMRGQSWRPIETAPKEKTVLLTDGQYVEQGFRDSDGWRIHNNGDYVDGGYGNPYRCGGSDYAMPTHWQLLPAPPQQEPAE